MNRTEQPVASTGIDETIGRIEDFYRRIAGADAPAGDAPYAPIPAEKDPVTHVEEQLDRLFAMLGPVAGPAVAWAPPVTVAETDTEIVVQVEIPGVPRDAVSVTAQGNALVVTGHRLPRVENGQRVVLNERLAGPFRRVIVLPDVRSAEPAANLREGVLEIRIARERPVTKPRPVTVN